MEDTAATDINEATPALTSTASDAKTEEVVERDDAISSTTSDKYIESLDTSTLHLGADCDAEADFLEAELSISSIASEKITENVEDIVQDLENLLGGSSEYFGRDASVATESQSAIQSGTKTQLVSSQEVTSANAPSVDVEQFNDVQCANEVTNVVVELLPPVIINEVESTEIQVDSTVNSKTECSLNAIENVILNEAKGGSPIAENKESTLEEPLNVDTAIDATAIPNLPKCEESDCSFVEKDSEGKKSVDEIEEVATDDGLEPALSVNPPMTHGHEGLELEQEVTTSQCADIESKMVEQQTSPANVIEASEQVSLPEVLHDLYGIEQNNEHHEKLVESTSFTLPPNIEPFQATELEGADAKHILLVEQTTDKSFAEVDSSVQEPNETAVQEEIAKPTDIDSTIVSQGLPLSEDPHNQDVEGNVLSADEKVLEQSNQPEFTNKEEECIDHIDNDVPIQEILEDVNSDKATSDVQSAREHPDLENNLFLNSEVPAPTGHQDSMQVSESLSLMQETDLDKEIAENSKEMEDEQLPENAKLVENISCAIQDELPLIEEDLFCLNDKNTNEIGDLNQEVNISLVHEGAAEDSINSEVLKKQTARDDDEKLNNKEEMVCINVESSESVNQMELVNNELGESESDKLMDELPVVSALNDAPSSISEIVESQQQPDIIDFPVSPFVNKEINVDAVACNEPLFLNVDAESLCVTDGMLQSVNETEDDTETDTFSNTDNVEFSENILDKIGDIPREAEFINQADDLAVAIAESEMQDSTLDLESACEDVSELDLACKSIQIEVVSEKIGDEMLRQDGLETQFAPLPPDESMNEQSIAIASIMTEMDGKDEEVPILTLDEPVPFPDLSEPLPDLLNDNLVDLVENKDDFEDTLKADIISGIANCDTTNDLRPLTVEVDEGVVSSEQTTEVEEPSQSDIDSTHSILTIYNPEDTSLEVAQPIQESADALKNDEVPSTTTEILQPTNTDTLTRDQVHDKEVGEANITTASDNIQEISTGSDSDTADRDVSSTCDTIVKEIIKENPAICSSNEKKSDLSTRSNLEEDGSNFISNIVIEKLERMHSPKITIKPIVKPSDSLGMCSPKPAILKPEEAERESLKITLKSLLKSSSESHYVPERYNTKVNRRQVVKLTETSEQEKPAKITIKPMSKYDDNEFQSEDRHSPKITIKPIRKPAAIEELQSSRLSIKPISHSSEETEEQRPSPKITIKPIVKPSDDSEDTYSKFKTKFSTDRDVEERHSPKITIKPIPKPSEEYNSKLIIKPVTKCNEFESASEERHSPKIIIKPIKPPDDMQISVEDQHGAKVTIKPIPKDEVEDKSTRFGRKSTAKRDEYSETSSPRITIKPIIKPQETYERTDDGPTHPFKLNIKPVVRPAESSLSPKVTIKPVPKSESVQPFELIDFEEQIKQERIVLKIPKNRKGDTERINKIKVKLSKDHGVAQILPSKRPSTETMESEPKIIKTDASSDLSINLISTTQTAADIKKEVSDIKKESTDDIVDPLSEIPVFEITLETASQMNTAPKPSLPLPISVPPTPRKRGRPRKVPLEVREEFKDVKEEGPVVIEPVESSSRPKRSCRGTSVRATLGIKPRKPRGGGSRGRGRPPGSRTSTRKERKPYVRKSHTKDSMIPDFKDFDVKHGEFKHVPLPIESGNRDVVIYEEETRMSADNSSRAQTPAKQVLTSTTEVIEESQSSIQSNTTTESGEKLQKIRKGTRLEVHQEPEGEVISADKLAEYSWGGGGPYMLQEQVAQFLGIKSFKRKYPGIHRRPVDMQERDFIRESCLASEAMCDMGLTAVKREDILDIMYTDFQHKYEEYCKHQRDRQAKDVSNKQKALSLAASQEKNKLDIVEQAVQSAFQWNANFNKNRKEQRRACLDLQTFTVHYPKGKMKQINKPPPGSYPLALVPGQYSDYYKRYNPMELSKLPLNTVSKKVISVFNDTEDSQSDGSGSDSDSSSSDSDSSYSGSSVEDCKMCAPVPTSVKKLLVH